MKKTVIINSKIEPYIKTIQSISGDKSISIRFLILASLAFGKSVAYNLSNAEDIINTLKCIRKFGIKVKLKNKYCEVYGNGLYGYEYKKNISLDAGNSGTAARLLSAILINSPEYIKITGDNSLKKRDMKRIVDPLKEFGAKFRLKKNTLPLLIKGSEFIRPINYRELRGSAQCKSAVMLAALFAPGTTNLKCAKSRDHTELFFKNVIKVPIQIKKNRNFDFIKIKGKKIFKSFTYNIPGDISSAAFFIVLTILNRDSSLLLKNININNSRIGLIKILNLMGSKITFHNKKKYRGELVGDIKVKSVKKLKSIKCPRKLNSSAIDEMLLLFLVSSVAKGISTFSGLEELNKKESKRLDWGIKILKMIGIKTKKISNHGVKIYGNPNLKLRKIYRIKSYLKDHRIYMLTVIAGLTLGGKWIINDPDAIKTSFPSFNKLVMQLGAKLN
tara:strand:- start:3893 stop:5227 length:1335 start_codon:yes stop_codon:yes gene_type:complete